MREREREGFERVLERERGFYRKEREGEAVEWRWRGEESREEEKEKEKKGKDWFIYI